MTHRDWYFQSILVISIEIGLVSIDMNCFQSDKNQSSKSIGQRIKGQKRVLENQAKQLNDLREKPSELVSKNQSKRYRKTNRTVNDCTAQSNSTARALRVAGEPFCRTP